VVVLVQYVYLVVVRFDYSFEVMQAPYNLLVPMALLEVMQLIAQHRQLIQATALDIHHQLIQATALHIHHQLIQATAPDIHHPLFLHEPVPQLTLVQLVQAVAFQHLFEAHRMMSCCDVVLGHHVKKHCDVVYVVLLSERVVYVVCVKNEGSHSVMKPTVMHEAPVQNFSDSYYDDHHKD